MPTVILDLVFVIGLGMSTDGVALASMLSQCVSAGLIVRSLMRSKEIYSLSLKEVRFHKDKAIHALSVGVPAGLQNAIFSVANLFIQAGVNSFSTVVVEGNSAAGNVDNLVYSVMNAFYIACSSFVGQNYGAGKSRRVLKSYLLTLCYSAVAAAVLGGLFLLFGHQFLSLFTSESDVIEAGLARIWVMCFSFPISATMDCTTAALTRPWNLGKGLVPMIFVFPAVRAHLAWRGSTPCSPTSIRSPRSICSIRSRGYSRARRRSHTFCIAIRNMSSRWMRPTQRNEKELSERTALFLRPHWARVLFALVRKTQNFLQLLQSCQLAVFVIRVPRHLAEHGDLLRQRGTALPVLEQHGPFRAEGVHVDLTAAVGEDETILCLAHGRERRVAL